MMALENSSFPPKLIPLSSSSAVPVLSLSTFLLRNQNLPIHHHHRFNFTSNTQNLNSSTILYTTNFVESSEFLVAIKRVTSLTSAQIFNMIRLTVTLLSIVGLLSSTSQSLRFEILPGHTKCIAEDVQSKSMTVGKYNVVNTNVRRPLPESHKLTVRVISAYGKTYHYAERVDSGQFAFTAAVAGNYMACFWAIDHNLRTPMTIDFDWKTGVQAKDWSNIAKKGSVDVMELEMKKMYDTVNFIHQEMFYLREREEEMLALNRVTNSRMVWFGMLSLFICISVAGLQLRHLKTFFEQRKLI